MSSFSIEDVRLQLSKLGYENVPQPVIEKFMARMKQQQEELQQQQQQQIPSVASAASVVSSVAVNPTQLPPQPPSSSPFHNYAPPPSTIYPSPFANLPLSSPIYSSLAQPIIPSQPAAIAPLTTSTLPGLPLSLRTNPAFATATAPSVPSTFIEPIPESSNEQVASSTKKKSVTVEDASEDEDVENDRDFDTRIDYYEQKQQELSRLEERLKRHAEIAHSLRPRQPAVPAHIAPAIPSSHHTRSVSQSSSKENSIAGDRVPPPSTRVDSIRRGFGIERSNNLVQTSAYHTTATSKQRTSTSESELAAQAERELRNRIDAMQRKATLSARHSAAAPEIRTTRSRPSSAILSSHRPSAPIRSHSHRDLHDDVEEHEPDEYEHERYPHQHELRHHPQRQQRDDREYDENGLEMIDTSRSLRKTHAASVKKYQSTNPRYGIGGYRKCDPVTRYQSFKHKWQQSAFLQENKKHTQQQAISHPLQMTMRTWKA